MKQAKTAIFLLLLICLSRANQFQGWDTIATQSDPTNSSSCMLTLSDTVNSTAMTLTQWGSMGALQGAALGQCNYANFVFQSFFQSDSLSDVVAFQPNVDNNKVNATIDATVLINHNGTGCVKLPQTAISSDSYVCRFMWNTVSIFTALYGTGNFTFDTNQYTLLIPGFENIRSMSMQYNTIMANSSFPSNIVGILSDACGSNNNIPTLATTVVVSSTANLTQLLPGMSLAYTLVKQNGAPLGNYTVIPAKANANLFDNYWSNINCWSLQMTYADILPDMDMCKSGCQFSFIFTNSRQGFFLLETMGVATANTTITGSGSNTIGVGNSDNNGNGNGNGSSNSNSSSNTNGTNTNNGNNTNTNGNPVSKSATSLGIQMVIVALIALVCLNF